MHQVILNALQTRGRKTKTGGSNPRRRVPGKTGGRLASSRCRLNKLELRRCYADAGFANAEGAKSQCGLVCCLTYHPELVKTGRFDLSTITRWQSSTIKRVVRSTLAAEGYAVSEGP